MKPMKRRFLILGAGAVLLGAVGFAQLRTALDARNEIFNSPSGKALLETYTALRMKYLKDVPSDTLLKGAVAGMVDSLQDEFTYYLEPDTSATQAEDLQGEFFGIGVGIVPAYRDGNGTRIETVFSGSPAAGAGLQPGDVIEKVNGEDVTKISLDRAVRKIRGPKDTVVKLTVRRGAGTLEISITRKKIDKINVSSTILPGNIGYVALSDFANWKVVDQLQAALKDFKAKNVRGVVFDLRNNPGGLVDQAEGVADSFLQKGDVFITRDRSQKAKVEYSAQPNATDYTGPLVVLVNESSASASEIVSAAIQENGRGKVVGEKTFGKGVANIPTKLSNGAQVNIAFEEWLTPKRNSIYKKGVTPDVIVEDTRYPKLLTLEGLNAQPGSQIEVKVNGKSLKLKADAQGRFTYQDDPTRVQTSNRQGTALVNLESDAQLRKALELLGATATTR
jgi:carboxyl-terminal processing protease